MLKRTMEVGSPGGAWGTCIPSSRILCSSSRVCASSARRATDASLRSTQAAFGASAVLSLMLVLGTAAAAASSPARRALLLGRDDAALRSACCADVGRFLLGCAANYLQLARRAASWVGARAPCTLGARRAARLVAMLVLPALVGVPLTLTLTRTLTLTLTLTLILTH